MNGTGSHVLQTGSGTLFSWLSTDSELVSCKIEPWPIIPLDVIVSLIIVCILLYILWVGGSIAVWLGIMPAIIAAWTILWIIYYFAIPIYGSLIISEIMRLPKRWQKIMALIIMISYTIGISSIFSVGLATWFLVMTLFYLNLIFSAIPYKSSHSTQDALYERLFLTKNPQPLLGMMIMINLVKKSAFNSGAKQSFKNFFKRQYKQKLSILAIILCLLFF
jgi:hypothetical protein